MMCPQRFPRLPRCLSVVAALAVLSTQAAAQQQAHVSLQLKEPRPDGARAVVDAQVLLVRIGSRDTVSARTDSTGRATVQLSPGRHARTVRKVGYDYVVDTITVEAGEIRGDLIEVEAKLTCLGQPCYTKREIARLQEQYRRLAASPHTWRCAPRDETANTQLDYWREEMRDTVDNLVEWTPRERRAGPRLVTDRSVCRRIAHRLNDLGELRSASLLVIRLGDSIYVEQDGGPRLILTRDLQIHTRLISQ